MASLFITKQSLAVLVLIYLFIFPSILGNADEYQPEIGSEGGEGYESPPQTGTEEGAGYEYPPQTGGDEDIPHTGAKGADDPAGLVAKALLCFNDKHGYSSCEESYRLTESGNIDVPPEYTDQYCIGPCLTETHLVLNCIDNILSHFLFYNRATTRDIKETIKAACSHGPKRGDFNVAEHVQAKESSAQKGSKPVLFGFFLMIIYYIGYNLLLW